MYVLYRQGRSPQSGRSGIGRTTFSTLIFKKLSVAFDCGFDIVLPRAIYLVPVSLVRLLFDMATASFPDICSVPHQPTSITFPKRSFGKKVVALRTFQASWFRTWKCIHYDETNDKAFCFYCMKGFKENKPKAPNADQAFVSTYKGL